MEPQIPVPLGRKVRLIKNYWIGGGVLPGVQLGDEISIADGKLAVKQIGPRRPPAILPKGTEGIVTGGPYSSGLYRYEVECPVRWNFKHPDLPTHLGTPWEYLEFVD